MEGLEFERKVWNKGVDENYKGENTRKRENNTRGRKRVWKLVEMWVEI